jgi:predicted GNAT family acetyltransferase
MQITHEPHLRRFVARREGHELGRLTYLELDDIVEAHRTYVEPSARGQGVAGALLDAFVGWVQADERHIRSLCSYVTRALITDPDRRELLVA